MNKTKKELKRELNIKDSDNFYRLAEVYKKIDKCSQSNYIGSGIVLTIKNINKENFVICDDFMIIDGLSDETIQAIKKDIKRSYDLKMALIPKI